MELILTQASFTSAYIKNHFTFLWASFALPFHLFSLLVYNPRKRREKRKRKERRDKGPEEW
tara:strand:+ start:69 stop:251 length:183 start_codon:yes stop_codon:yes gene_type:complete